MEYGNGERNQLVWRSPENRYHNEDFCVDRNNQNVNVAMLAKKFKLEAEFWMWDAERESLEQCYREKTVI